MALFWPLSSLCTYNIQHTTTPSLQCTQLRAAPTRTRSSTTNYTHPNTQLSSHFLFQPIHSVPRPTHSQLLIVYHIRPVGPHDQYRTKFDVRLLSTRHIIPTHTVLHEFRMESVFLTTFIGLENQALHRIGSECIALHSLKTAIACSTRLIVCVRCFACICVVYSIW
jgi:hypothetical protein